MQALKHPLSGYLGGQTPRGGYWTDKLEEAWSHVFGCKYAIPCNSATSGLFAACMASGIKKDDIVWTTPYSMSATAACALVLGAKVKFIDIEPMRYSINPGIMTGEPPKALIVTNLFGHPAYLSVLRSWCDLNNVIMIEDNAQSIYAKEGKHYAGTVGHIGVFSLNVHKHLQCGEGGILTTSDSSLANNVRGAINHGELANHPAGLNLRMTEPTAAIACAQLEKIEEIIRSRRRIAHAITGMMAGIPWISPPVEDMGCKHSYYVWAGRIEDQAKRRKFCHELNLRGFPIRAGYSRLLTDVFRTLDNCPVAHRIEHREIITYEVCGYDPKAHHLTRMKEIVNYVAEIIDNGDRWKNHQSRDAALRDSRDQR
jgi:dTDP-4-amino-4,6-dideoxygalactose transaminase